MNANELIDRAERYCFPGDAAHIRSEIEAAQRRIVCAIATPARKPSPLMLRAVGATEYWGDSPEDAEAAHNAGVPFVHVERFL